MKRVFGWCLPALFAMALTVSASAATLPAAAKSQQSNSLKAQVLLDSLTRTIAPVPVDHATIGHIEALGLKPTAANVRAVQQLLARKGDPTSTASLVYLLGSLYTRDDQAGQDAMIARTLKGFILGSDPNVATAALLSYSRTGYQPDRIDLLDYGLSHNLLNEADYCRELALGLPYSAAPDQLAAATRLAAKNNPFGAEVLALAISSQISITHFSPESREVLVAFLEKREPVMPMATGEFGVTDGIRYCYWLSAMTRLEEADGKVSGTTYILEKLSKPDTDPRKILSYLSSPEGARFMKTVGRSALAQVVDRGLLPARQFPGHPIFTPMAEEIMKTLASLRN